MSFRYKDSFFKKAKKESYLARSVYKLQEIEQKFKVFKGINSVIDFGYYPGSWTQYCLEKLNINQKIVGVDIQSIQESLLTAPNLKLYQLDIFELEELSQVEVERPFDLILSDMAPSTSGIKFVDQQRSLDLIQKIFGLFDIFLSSGGSCVLKVFESEDAQVFLRESKSRFKTTSFLKPGAVRSSSKEHYFIGKGFIN